MSAAEQQGLPEADTVAEVLGTMAFVLHSLGRELGERYDAKLSAMLGADWVRVLARERGHAINKYDAHFVLVEPLRFSDSPTRACLPSGGAFYNQLEKALEVRNSWSHFEIHPMNLAALKTSIATLHDFATAAELKLGALCSIVRKRINAIANGQYPGANTPQRDPEPDEVSALLVQLDAARAKEAALQADVDAAQSLLDEAARAGAAQAELERRLELVQAGLDAALADKEKLEFIIQGMAGSQGHETPASEWIDAIPGHPWPGEIPERRVIMMTLQPDLFDEATRSRVAEEFGPHASAVIAGWKATVPPQATVFLTAAGQAITFISGTPIYLGSLADTEPQLASPSQAVGFFVPNIYTLRMSGIIEDRESGDTLFEVNPWVADEVADRLLEAVPTGARIRVTTTGGVAVRESAEWRLIGSVEPDEWFPGHL